MLCVWWDQGALVYFELLKPGETVNTKCYQQQLTYLNRSLIEKGQKEAMTMLHQIRQNRFTTLGKHST